MKNSILVKVLDLIDSGYWKSVQWKEWADAVILISDDPSYWIIQLCTARDSSEAVSILRENLANIQYVDNVNHKTIVLGYMFLRYEEREMSLGDFLTLAWQETEAEEDVGAPTNAEIFEMYEVCKNIPDAGQEFESLVKQVSKAFVKNSRDAIEALSEVKSYK